MKRSQRYFFSYGAEQDYQLLTQCSGTTEASGWKNENDIYIVRNVIRHCGERLACAKVQK